MKKYDVIIIGAGASGLVAGAVAVRRGQRVAIIDMGENPARKVRASGGGRCNFTNQAVAPNRYFGKNPDFVRGAIARVTPDDILEWAQNHKIRYVQKNPGQYFCANGAEEIVNALMDDARGADCYFGVSANDIIRTDGGFNISTDGGDFMCRSVVIATGGVSYPNFGVSDFGHKIAKKFGHKIVPVRPALGPIRCNVFPPELSGISIDVVITIGQEKIHDSMLFTHWGLGGPAIYRATVRDQNDFHINMAPGVDVYEILRIAKRDAGRKSVAGVLSEFLPARLARWICPKPGNIADYKDSELARIATQITDVILPRDDIRPMGMNNAEVVRGGVDVADVSSKTMESKLCPGLFLVGEVLDIAGDLGGFNLHWAWASGRVAGENV